MEKHQSSRDHVVDVKGKVVQFETDSILIGNYARLYMQNECLIIRDSKSIDCQIYLFDKRNFRYLAATAPLGEGPNEITNIGHIASGQTHLNFA